MSMAEAAQLLGIPYRTWQDWELGRRKPSDWCLRLIEDELERLSAHKCETTLRERVTQLYYRYMELGETTPDREIHPDKMKAHVYEAAYLQIGKELRKVLEDNE
jgi:hypothetical protein